MADEQIDQLMVELSSTHWKVREQAFIKLGKLDGERVLQTFIDVLRKEENSLVWQAARQALADFTRRDSRHFDYLVTMLFHGSPDAFAQGLLLSQIVRARKDLAVDMLIRFHETPSFDWLTRGHALCQLSSIGEERAAAYFKKHQRGLILAAEDELDIRQLIAFTLLFAGYTVIQASNGEEALELMRRNTPDLALLDVRMPRMTGYEACRKAKQDPAIRQIPVVFLSAKGQESEIQQGLEAGAEEYWLKPFTPDKLYYGVRDILRKCRLGVYDN
jgi:CheY-like chemotaxis protein